MSAPSLLTLADTWRLDPAITVGVSASALAYVSAAHKLRCSAGSGRRSWPVRRTAFFLGGLAAVTVALESGLDAFDDQLLSVHMIQHLVLILVAPPLLLAARPATLLIRVLGPEQRRRVIRVLRGRVVTVLSLPATGLAVFGATMLSTHLTPLYELALTNNTVHAFEHLLYLIAGLLFWAVLIPPGPTRKQLDGLGQVVYLLLGMPFMSAVGVIFETGSTPRYVEYVYSARRMGISALADQRLAGTEMWIGGTAAMGVLAIALAWRSMVDEERLMRRREIYGDRLEEPAMSYGDRLDEPAMAGELERGEIR